MKIAGLLDKFYKKNKLPVSGGEDMDTFRMSLLGINITMPNPEFRRKVIYIHDIEHVLNNCDTSWEGESFIAGWEISTGLWRHFPIMIFSLFAMGYSFWLYPKTVYNGFKKGINNIGIIDLNYSKAELLDMDLNDLVLLVEKENKIKMGLFKWIEFIFWLVISQIILLFPIIILLSFIYLF